MKRSSPFSLNLLVVTALTTLLAACGGGDPSEPSISVTISPRSVSLEAGASAPFAAAVAGTDNKAITWSVREGSAGGRVSEQGIYTAPNTVGTYHVVATSVADPSQSATATVTVTQPEVITVSISPSAVTLAPGALQAFSAVVTGTQNTSVTWSVQEGGAGGTVTAQGVYTAPAAEGTYHVVARSVDNPSRSATATVTVSAGTAVAVSIQPSNPTLLPLMTLQFQATVQGHSNTAVTWSVQEGSVGGTITAQGLYTAPDAEGEFHIIAVSVADSTKSATATVRVARGVSVSISPSPVTVSVGGQQSFTAAVLGTPNTAVTWSVQEGSAGGSVSAQGVYTAPNTVGTYHVVATSVADPSKSATATVNVTSTPVVSVVVSPNSATLPAGGTRSFTATVSGTSNTAVTWSVVEQGGGTITAQGLYTAPATRGTYRVVATSVSDPTKSATALVTVLPPLTVAIVPPRLEMMVNGQQTFAALVRNASNPDVRWTVREGTAGGIITTDGTYTAPATPGTYHVEAMSLEDPSKSASVAVSVRTARTVSVAVTPGTAVVATGEFLSFTSTVTGASYTTRVDWRVEEPEGGTINTKGVYLAPSTPGTFHVVATSQDEPTKDAVATVTVLPPAGVRVRAVPRQVVMTAGGRQTFSASVSGVPNQAVTWFVSGGASSGTITADGTYTAPTTPGVYSIRVSSVVDSSAIDVVTAIVQSTGGASAVISPATVTLAPGAYQGFTLSSGPQPVTPTSVTWRVLEGRSGGAVSLDGLYRAPASEGTYHVMGTHYDEVFAVATVKVARQLRPTVSVLPSRVRMGPGQQQSFAAYVAETSNQAVTWTATAGTISPTGLYTAPNVPGTYQVQATTVATPQDTRTVQVVVEGSRESGVIINATAVTVRTGAYFAFSGMNTGVTNNAVSWSVLEGPAGGAMTMRGEYIAPLTAGTYTVMVDGGGFPGPETAYAVVRVVEPTQTSVSVLPQGVTVPPGGKLSFIASVSGNADTRVQWTASGGTMTEGLYTAPTAPGLYTVIARSLADPAKTAGTTVTVSGQPDLVSMGLNPASRVVAPGAFASFQLELTSASPTSANAVGARVLESPEGGELISLDYGTLEYFAPSTPGLYHLSGVLYSYSSGGFTEALGRVLVAPGAGVSVSLRPNPVTLPVSSRQTFTARVAGTANTAVSWSATGGTIEQDGTYTTPSQPGTYTVTAQSLADTSKRASATVQVVPGFTAASVAVSPQVVTVPPGGTVSFTAAPYSPFFPYIYWRVVGGSRNGSIDSLGNYKAPITPGVYSVMVSAIDGDLYAHAVATVIVE
ncbi:MAG TPA: hypothetical protein VK539_26770 [Myxococcaceae bacterium]|nr:hypothetical protein [Myxococcaceae bacterium]